MSVEAKALRAIEKLCDVSQDYLETGADHYYEPVVPVTDLRRILDGARGILRPGA